MLSYPQGQSQSRILTFTWLSQAGLLLAWLYFNRLPLQWLMEELHQASFLNLLLFVGIGGWMGWQAYQQRQVLLSSGRTNGWAMGLLAGSAVAAIVLPWWLDLEQLPVVTMVLGTYGWLGLNINANVWRRGIVLAVLMALLLPFSLQQGTGFGFPVRVLTAQVVEQLLAPWQVGAISSQDVIVIENRVALVDLPCSGLKSMWMGSLFLLAATWVQGRRLGWQWLGLAVANLGLLIGANIGRVLALVVITSLLKQPQLGEVLHVPLGLVGFTIVCGCSWWLLDRIPATPKLTAQIAPLPQANSLRLRRWQALMPLVVALSLIGLRGLPGPTLPTVPSLADLAWPNQFERQPLPLTASETNFFGRQADTQVAKQSFTYGPLSGSMLLVSSRSWRSQHAPELCFSGNGNRVEHLGQAEFTNFSARWLELNQGNNSATYWFQAKQTTTPDFLTRLWSQIRRQEETWVMVSLLFNQPQQPQEPVIQDFVGMVHSTLHSSLATQSISSLATQKN